MKQYTITQVARQLNVSTSTVRRWIAEGRLAATRHPLVRRWQIADSAIAALTGARKSRREATMGKADVEAFLAVYGRRKDQNAKTLHN